MTKKIEPLDCCRGEGGKHEGFCDVGQYQWEQAIVKERDELRTALEDLVKAAGATRTWYKHCEGIDYGGNKACGTCPECRLDDSLARARQVLGGR